MCDLRLGYCLALVSDLQSCLPSLEQVSGHDHDALLPVEEDEYGLHHHTRARLLHLAEADPFWSLVQDEILDSDGVDFDDDFI